MKRSRVVLLLAVLVMAAAVGAAAWRSSLFGGSPSRQGAVLDPAGLIPAQDLPRFNEYIGSILRESGVEIHLVLLRGLDGKPIEAVATQLMDQLKIGGRAGQERGLLLLYDMQGKRMRVEVGYGLEGWFPDSFVNYLVEDHARMFFSSGDVPLGLRLMLRLVQHRIREAVIGNDFDPRVLPRVQALAHFSGGGGASATVGLRDHAGDAPGAAPADPVATSSGSSPTQTYYHYLEWLSRWPPNPQVDLFTPGSRGYLAAFKLSRAYAEFILMGEYGKRFQVVERDGLALIYFTGTPFVSPHFLVRQDGRWRMDLIAEVRNTRERVGGEYTWDYRGQDDPYTRTFGDLLTTLGGVRRFRDGDNRPLILHGSGPAVSLLEKAELAPGLEHRHRDGV